LITFVFLKEARKQLKEDVERRRRIRNVPELWSTPDIQAANNSLLRQTSMRK
jgi:hypothetical protein